MRKSALLLVGPALLVFALVGSEALGVTFNLDFNTDPSALGVVFTGSAEWRTSGGVGNSGYLKVTDATNDQRGAIIFPDLGAGQTFPGFSIRADLRVGGGTDLPADGFSFNYARPEDLVFQDPVGEGWAGNPDGTEENLPEEGTMTGLAIGFDEWYSGGADVIGMSVRVDNDLIHQVALPTLHGAVDDITSLQTGPRGPGGPGDISELGWARLEIDLSTDKLLRIAYKGNVVFEDYVDYTPGPSQLVFGGRTGGANAAHHIDNISVTLIPEASSLAITLTALVGLLRRRRRVRP